jgi:predicted RNA-binding protein associated with RNAse of E/G family
MSDLTWRKSSRSGEDNCLEVAAMGAVRDSKNPDGPVLLVDVTALVAAVKAGQIA